MHRVWAPVLISALLAESAAAIVTSDTSGSHIVTPGQTSFGINPDGVVMVGALSEMGDPVASCSGALISDRHVLSAAHCFDGDADRQVDSSLGFFPHEMVFELPDGLVAIEYELESIQWPDEWPAPDGDLAGDLAVVTLTEDAPMGVPRYPLYVRRDEVGQAFVLVGYGHPGHGATGEAPSGDARATKRAGLNRYDAICCDEPGVEFLVYDFDSGQLENNSLAIFGFESDVGFGADEVLQAPGDSGAPTFIGGAIAGVASWGGRLSEADINEERDRSWGEGGFDTRVSSFRAFILDATDGTAVFVPEPSTWLLSVVGCTGTCMVLTSRRRRSAFYQTRVGHS